MEPVKSYLLDTHTFLWAVQECHKLGQEAIKVIENPATKLYLSAVSALEVTTKYRIGKLPDYANVVENYDEIAHKFHVIELPVSSAHAYFSGKFEWVHKDPFDRLLAAQASIENLTLITNDSVFGSLPWIETLW
jgi:PIN domain nuclease of toxin-antitoxin system